MLSLPTPDKRTKKSTQISFLQIQLFPNLVPVFKFEFCSILKRKKPKIISLLTNLKFRHWIGCRQTKKFLKDVNFIILLILCLKKSFSSVEIRTFSYPFHGIFITFNNNIHVAFQLLILLHVIFLWNCHIYNILYDCTGITLRAYI